MKIVCESCGAKYSIADDRVAGKVFKIRCKRCSEVIVVRGDQDAGGAAAAAAAQVDDQNAIWHVVVDGEQAGPYSVSQLAELMHGGRVDWEAYVWAEGFDNWMPMRDIPDLVNQLSGQPQAAAEPAYRAPSTGTLTGQPSMGADPFADADHDGGMFGGGGGGGHDLFAAAPEPASPFGGVVASSPSPRVAAESAMTGARNENSVLFSLKNLQALATGTPSMSPPTGGMMSGGGGPAGGFAAGEGSGLIDIRALAAATGVSDSRGAGGTRDELLTIGSQGGAFGSLGSPILAPGAGDDDGNKKTVIWAVVAAVAIASAAAVAIVFVLKEPATQQPVGMMAPAGPVAPAPAPVAPVPTTPTPDPGAQAAAPEETAKPNGPSGSGSGTRKRRSESSGDSKPSESSSPGSSAGPTSAPSGDAPKAAAKPSGPRSLDDLLNDAVSPGAAKAGPSAAPKSDLAETPSRDQVKTAMGSVKDDVSACAKNGETGVATVSVSVAGESGRVTNAQVSGVTGPIGTCIAQAVRKAQFPKFSNKVFKVAFPFKL